MYSHRLGNHDRLWSLALVAFVAVQLTYLYFDFILLSPPAPDAPIGELRAVARDHAELIRWHALMPLFNFVFLFLPASIAMARRLRRTSSERSPWPDLVVPAALLVTALAIPGLELFAVMGMVPVAELSDSVLRSAVMINAFTIWCVGSVVVALFLISISLSLLQAEPRSRSLAWFGIAAAGCGLAGQLWLINRDFDGPLFGLNVLARGMFLAWLAWAGIWFYRSAAVEERRQAPSEALERVGSATP